MQLEHPTRIRSAQLDQPCQRTLWHGTCLGSTMCHQPEQRELSQVLLMGNGLDQTRRVTLYVLLMLPQNQSILGAILNQIVAQEPVGP